MVARRMNGSRYATSVVHVLCLIALHEWLQEPRSQGISRKSEVAAAIGYALGTLAGARTLLR